MRYVKYEVRQKTTVRKFLLDRGFSKRSTEEILDNGYLLNNKLSKKSKDLMSGDKVDIIIEDENLDYEPIDGSLNIIYEDSSSLVIAKEPGLTVNSKGQVSLANYIANYFKKEGIKSKVRFVNRLDMDTSGLILIAKNKFAHAYYQKQIEANQMEKKYLAVVDPKVDYDFIFEKRFTYNKESKSYKANKEGKICKTIFKTVFTDDTKSVIECNILTGKTHLAYHI